MTDADDEAAPSRHDPRGALVWFRDDLRVADNPALTAAAATEGPTTCVYVLEASAAIRPLGAATQWWLHHSLTALSKSLDALGGVLVLRAGDPETVIPDLAAALGVEAVFWNRRYAPGETALDGRIKAGLEARGVRAKSFNANLLHEPWTVTTQSGAPYRVFAPFWKACRAMAPPNAPLDAPARLQRPDHVIPSDDLDSWALPPARPNWAAEFAEVWTPGEAGARARLDTFLEAALSGYAASRDTPSGETTSLLSPHLRWGEIGPRQIAAALDAHAGLGGGSDKDKFLAEIGWREFAKSVLFHAEDIATQNWKPAFDAFPWRDAPDDLAAWTEGRTGYPLVDAGMRQLWRIGWMHNRVRMVAASFLVKHLLIDWRAGERWFWNTLVDADAASNPVSWQWVAGSGADAAPYFRIFNPATQAAKFDPDGAYVAAWAASNPAAPIVDHAFARRRALDAYAACRA